MRVLRWFALAALSYTTLAAKKPSDSPYSNFVAKQSSSPIELDEQAYYDLTSTPRDYTAAIFLTARDAKFACTLCRATEPEWITVANSWRKADRKGDHRMIFASLDFVPGRKVFMQVRKQPRGYYKLLTASSCNYKLLPSSSSFLLRSVQMLLLMDNLKDWISWDLKMQNK